MSSPNFQAGRISKHAFVASTAVFFALCLLSAASRFYIRLRIQKQLSFDDGFLLFGLCCLVCALVILYTMAIDKMYLVLALTTKLPNAEIPPDFLEQSYDFHKWITITLMLSWSAIMAVKFSFLFLFRKLIDRIKPLTMYWWVVTVFNIAVLGYGVSVYYLACPYYYDPRNFQCSLPSGVALTMRHSIAQTVLDLIGDLLILAFSLCLTVVMILVTITRISGIKLNGSIDQVWETYFIILAAEIGIILTSVTAFRAFFISRRDNNKAKPPPGNQTHWYSQDSSILKRLFTPSLWRSKSKEHSSSEGYKADGDGHFPMEDLPDVPRAQMTGIRTFINGNGKGMSTSRIMESQASQDDDDAWPIHAQHQEPESKV
ncbi:short-chain dehydrogenase [Physcia stellaris]|nr:short-chain dehydrogenase [Physcia stellaris]